MNVPSHAFPCGLGSGDKEHLGEQEHSNPCQLQHTPECQNKSEGIPQDVVAHTLGENIAAFVGRRGQAFEIYKLSAILNDKKTVVITYDKIQDTGTILYRLP